ncbi:MAG: protein kinase [Polyangiaceae bacterium]
MTSRKLKRSEQLDPSSHYELVLRLAAGGMGAVYVGRARTADPVAPFVAVKRAHAHLAEDATFRKMFVAEARLASRIQHPNVVGVRDIDESDGELLIVMDYVEGASLAELLAASQRGARRLPMAVALRIALDAALGLHAAHSARDPRGRLLGIVHRDVSPHNVLVGVDGVARIVDFGVAKAIDHDGTNTQSGILKGKAAYMAPEYLKGKIATPQSDVFSLGVVLWEGLTCKRLFRREDDVETMQRILDPAPAPPVSDVMFVEPAIDRVVSRALEKDPSTRYASCAELADDLERAARSLDLLAPPAQIGAVVEALLGEDLGARRALIEEAVAALGDRTIERRSPFEPLVAAARAPMMSAAAQQVAALPPLALPPIIPQRAGGEPPRAALGPAGSPPMVNGNATVQLGPTSFANGSSPMVAARTAPSFGYAANAAAIPSTFAATPARVGHAPALLATLPIAATTAPPVATPVTPATPAKASSLVPLAVFAGCAALVGGIALGVVQATRSMPAAPLAETSTTAPVTSGAAPTATQFRSSARDVAPPPPDPASSATAPVVAVSSLPSARPSAAPNSGLRPAPVDPRKPFTPKKNPY